MIKHAMASQDGPILPILLTDLDIDAPHAKWLCEFGAIYHNQQRIKSSEILIKKGDYLRVHALPRRFPVTVTEWKTCVIEETEGFVVINKPFGVPTHASVDNLFENAAHQMSLALNSPIFVTHRLDVATSGILFFAKTKEMQRQFNQALKEGQVEKTYLAKVAGTLRLTGIVEHFMEASQYLPKKISKNFVEGWQQCLLEILHVQPENENTLATIRLITGRTHQIRAQMSELGHPILGDVLYSGEVRDRKVAWGQIEKIDLSARSLRFKLSPEQNSPEYFYSL